MRKTFLEYVAEDLLKKFGTDLSRVTLVFPNHKSGRAFRSSPCIERKCDKGRTQA